MANALVDTKSELNEAEIRRCIRQLRLSHKGQRTIDSLSAMLDDGAVSLDQGNQEAVVSLLVAAWGPLRGTTLDLLREFASLRPDNEA